MVYFLYFFSKGRKFKVPPHILFKIFIYAMSNGVYSTRMIQQQCEENINYMWLLQGYSAPSHMIFQCFFARCTLNILMNLFLQLMEAINRHDTLTVNDTLRMYKNDDIRMYNFNCITDTIVEVITTCNTYTLLTVHLL